MLWSNANVSSEDESLDGEVTGSNCCGKHLKPMVPNNWTNIRICKGCQEATCGCNGVELGHCSKDIKVEDEQVNYSKVLVLHNIVALLVELMKKEWTLIVYGKVWVLFIISDIMWLLKTKSGGGIKYTECCMLSWKRRIKQRNGSNQRRSNLNLYRENWMWRVLMLKFQFEIRNGFAFFSISSGVQRLWPGYTSRGGLSHQGIKS